MTTLYTILVAINNYPDPRHTLNGCINDLNAIKKYLEGYCQQADIKFNCTVLTNQKASRDSVIASFKLFEQAKEGDFCLFFYAGHGARWAAPKVFWHIEPDHYNESLVLYDSRTEGGRDLMDKELSYLIWKATQGRDVHFLLITDCCHSGTITRLTEDGLPLIRERRTEKVEQEIPLEKYFGIDEYIKGENGEVSPPRGRYLHLAASRANQTAKEVYVKGIPRGVFTYFLEQALLNTKALISYAELLNRININVSNQVRDQSPQLDAPYIQDKNLVFLSANTKLEQGHFLLSYSQTQGWNVNAGAIHHVQSFKNISTQFELVNDKRILQAREIFLNHSTVNEIEGLEKDKIYPVRLIPFPPQPLLLAFAAKNEKKGQEQLQKIIQYKNSGLYQLTSSINQAQYLIHCRNNAYYLTSAQDRRPLFKYVNEYKESSAIHFLNQLEIISQWRQLLTFSNPGTKIKDEEFRIEFYCGTEPANSQNDAPMELVDWREAVKLFYSQDERQWHRPTFQLKVGNTGKRKLWFSILYLGDDFSINNMLLPMQELAPGEYAWAVEVHNGKTYRTHQLMMDEVYHEWGISSITDYFKIIVSTHEFDTHSLNQDGLEPEYTPSPSRRFSFRKSISHFDWTSKEIQIHIQRPLPGLSIHPQYPAKMFDISILPSENWQADAQWLTLEEATKSYIDHFHAYLPDGNYFCPAEMGPQENLPGLCVLQLSNITHSTVDIPSILTLTFNEREQVKKLQAYYWNSKERKLIKMEVATTSINSIDILIPAISNEQEVVLIFFHRSPSIKS